jgi:dihydroflavonol-4-reductase
MKVFVTGGTGFIGSALVKRLVESDNEVVCLVRRKSRISNLKELGVELAFGDIRFKDTMAAPISECDKVFHVAAWYELGIWNRRRMFETNVIGTRNVLELALAHNKKVIYCSTTAALGHSGNAPKNENSKRSAIFTSEYERTKYLALVESNRYAERGLNIIIIMPSAVFGPGDTSLVGFILKKYIKGKLGYFIKMGAQFSWVHVYDVVDGILLADRAGKNGESYLFADTNLRMLEFLKKAEEFSHVPVPKRLVGVGMVKIAAPFGELYSKIIGRKAVLSREASVMLQKNWTYDSSKARNELGWKPLDFNKRLEDTIEWYIGQYSRHERRLNR